MQTAKKNIFQLVEAKFNAKCASSEIKSYVYIYTFLCTVSFVIIGSLCKIILT